MAQRTRINVPVIAIVDSGTGLVGYYLEGKYPIAGSGGTVPLDNISGAAQGFIIRGNAAGVWESYDANDDGKILVGDGSDINSVGVTGDLSIDSAGVTEVTALHLYDASVDHFLNIDVTEELTADRILTVAVSDANRTLALGGDLTIGGGLTFSAAAYPLTVTFPITAGQTNVVTASSDVSAGTEALLKSTATGALTLARLGVGASAIAADGTIALPDAGYIGNGAATARLGFDSSGATDYAIFENCYVGIGTTPSYSLDVAGAGYFAGTIYPRPATSASSIALDFNHGYDVYVDNVGAGSDNTRLWVNTPAGAEIVFGPRGSSSFVDQIRYRSVAHRFENGGTVADWVIIDDDGIGFGGGATAGYRLDLKANAMRYAEMSPPSAPAANSVVMFARDNGSGKTQLCARFATGAIQVLATEP